VTEGATASWRQLWIETTARLGGGPEAANEARWLCQEVSGSAGPEWALGLDAAAAQRAVARLDALVARRLAGEPLQYVLGSWGFRQLDLFVDGRVLIPRPETEGVVDVALELLAGRERPLVVADLGTGSGAIALSLARELPLTGVEIWATDASADALDVARANLAGLGREAVNVRLAEGNWFDALPDSLQGRLDLIVSNPPYVATGDDLPAAVRDWEPVEALFAGADGLDALRVLVAGAAVWLRPGGSLVVEIGTGQGGVAVALAEEAGLVAVVVRPDLAGRDRVLVAGRPGPSGPSGVSGPSSPSGC
jgi:release factor glutamine methyltransferase